MTIADILKDSNYNISLFSEKEINQFETDILFRNIK